MPPTKSQKAAKVADNVDDNQGFVEKQRGMYRAVSLATGELSLLPDRSNGLGKLHG
jgi:hypothetical protein